MQGKKIHTATILYANCSEPRVILFTSYERDYGQLVFRYKDSSTDTRTYVTLANCLEVVIE